MNVPIVTLLLVVCAGCSFVLTGYARRYALSRQLIDNVSARASHSVPTARGGGIAIVLTALAGLAFLYWAGIGAPPMLIAMIGGGAAVAIIGWIDDHGHVPSLFRLAVHFAAAGWGVFWLGPILPPFFVPSGIVFAVATTATMFFIVWCINLFNFMDGIDGLASSEAIILSIGSFLAFALATGSISVGVPCLMVGAATIGFVWWNWPPARIFMGDVSSGFLGFVAGILIVAGSALDWRVGCAILILFGAFFVDAGVTLVRRALRGSKVYEAHREHCYQILARRFGVHGRVTILYIAVSLVWLAPWAATVIADLVDPLTGLTVAFLPLIVAVWIIGAGKS